MTQQRQRIITIISINIIVIIFNRINNLKRICHGVEKGKLLGLAKTNIGSVSMFVPNFYTEIFDNKSCFLVFFSSRRVNQGTKSTIYILESKISAHIELNIKITKICHLYFSIEFGKKWF